MTSVDIEVAGLEDLILVTGAAGFIGTRVVLSLLDRGFTRLRLWIRPSSRRDRLESILQSHPNAGKVEVIEGNLLSDEDCASASRDAVLIYHLAAARGEKSFPDAFMNTVVTTRNLLRANRNNSALRRFVSISSFSVYSNSPYGSGKLLDESCSIEDEPGSRDAYCYAKVKQDEIVVDYGRIYKIPYVIVRPGVVYGPGNDGITGRVGLSGFGVFLHLGGRNPIPFTYVDNCADAIVAAGLKKGIDGEVFNVVDDDVPNSRQFLRMYKRNVRRFRSLYLPHWASYGLCWLWEKYSIWSEGQLPPVYSRRSWRAYWKKTSYSNEKIKSVLGWSQRVPSKIALDQYFENCRLKRKRA
jgi:nucleoside-diphosphate-sugar epimerase